MIRKFVLASLFLPAIAAANVPNCGTAPLAPLPETLPVQEMARPAAPVVTCLDAVAYVQRLRQPVPVVTAPPAADAYVPKTKDDNTPWRFDMNQNGRRMTAEEFDAWMKAKGIRVARGKAPDPVPAAPASEPAAASGQCVPSATVKC